MSLDDYRLYYKMVWASGGSQTDIADPHCDLDPESNEFISVDTTGEESLLPMTMVIGQAGFGFGLTVSFEREAAVQKAAIRAMTQNIAMLPMA